jgi:carbonic anhydrase
MMNNLISISTQQGIPLEYKDSPIGRFIEYHNLKRPFDSYAKAELLAGMCMDHRKRLRMPENFAYVIRAGGANLEHSDFTISFAIAVGGVKAIALIGHNDCGMVGLDAKREQFIQGLVDNAGWDRAQAESHFDQQAPAFEINHEITFILRQAKRLRHQYPTIPIAPFLYKVEDNLMYLIDGG